MKDRFILFRFFLFFLIPSLAIFSLLGCAAPKIPRSPQEKVPLLHKWHGDYPASQLSRLPHGYQDRQVGYIDDIETFLPIWRIFMPTEILPAIDFRKNFVVFTRNIKFYNQKSILTITLKDGTAEIIVMETLSSTPITDRVAMAMAVIPREGIMAIKSGPELIEVVQ